MVSQEDIFAVLRSVMDPEIGFNIVDLGLIYEIEIHEGRVEIQMTLTAPGCPLHAHIAQEIKEKIMALDGIRAVHVQFVWDPPWSVDRMSPVVKKEL